MSTETNPPTPKYILQTIVRAGGIPPDNDRNVWGDYSHLLILHARLAPADGKFDAKTATIPILFGCNGGEPVLKAIRQREAEEHQRNAWNSTAKNGILSEFPIFDSMILPPPEVIEPAPASPEQPEPVKTVPPEPEATWEQLAEYYQFQAKSWKDEWKSMKAERDNLEHEIAALRKAHAAQSATILENRADLEEARRQHASEHDQHEKCSLRLTKVEDAIREAHISTGSGTGKGDVLLLLQDILANAEEDRCTKIKQGVVLRLIEDLTTRTTRTPVGNFDGIPLLDESPAFKAVLEKVKRGQEMYAQLKGILDEARIPQGLPPVERIQAALTILTNGGYEKCFKATHAAIDALNIEGVPINGYPSDRIAAIGAALRKHSAKLDDNAPKADPQTP